MAGRTKSDDAPPINTDEGILAYLKRASPNRRYTTIEQLSGGNVNHLWRIGIGRGDSDDTRDGAATDATDQTTQTNIVVKHAEGFVRFNPGLALPAERMDFEARVMALVPRILSDSTDDDEAALAQGVFSVRVPRVLDYSPDSHVLTLSDGGRRTLKDAYVSLSTPQVQSIGVRLGKWLARLHARTANTDIGPGGNLIARAIYRYSYQNLPRAWEKSGLGGERRLELARRVNDEYGSLLSSDNECVAHGDFWPGNMLVADGFVADHDDVPVAGDAVQPEVPITVIDWEITRRGVGTTDVAQFAAEAYLLDRFRDVNHGLSGAFVRSYVAEAAPSKDFWKRFGVHWGVHVSFWPTTVEWANAEETSKFGALGVRVIEMAISDQEGLSDFVLGHFDDPSQLL